MAAVSVILPGAGAGRRFGGGQNKIFEPLAGRAIFLRALDAFAGREDVRQIQLVLSDEDIRVARQRFGRELESLNVEIVPGGRTRTESVRNALAGVCDEAELVCVHDAVRPCISQPCIDAVFQQAAASGAAILAWPMHGTVKMVSADGTIDRTVAREALWQAQTPQVFAKGLLLSAYGRDPGGATDDAQLVEGAGHAVHVVPGDPGNIKITTPADLELAEAIVTRRAAENTRSKKNP